MATILIVDDEFGVAEVLEAILEDSGHRVLTAINGRQGLEALHKEKADIVFLDFMMPVLDGPGTLRAMQADPVLSGIPVIVMSSLPEQAVQERASGYRHFIRKPFTMSVILSAVQDVLKDGQKATQ